MIKEEKLIEDMRKRKLCLAIFVIAFLISLFAAISLLFFAKSDMESLATMRLTLYNDPLADVGHIVPDMVYTSMRLNRIYIGMMLFSVCAGASIATFLINLLGISRDRLIIRLWERIEELERINSSSSANTKLS